MQRVIEYLGERRGQHLAWLTELCRIPSISTQEEHKPDVRRAVEWMHALCRRIGLAARVHDTPGHPILTADWLAAPHAPTYMAYGHVDVQPTGDLSLWDHDPFDPQVKDGWLIARGSADNKGQILVYLRAAQAWLETEGRLPVNLRLLIEGEEEIGSPNLMPFVRRHRDELRCAGILISDTGLFRDGWPTITTGTRGLVYKEVGLSGPKHDIHSGCGGPVVNPGNVLARLIASLHDSAGRVNIPGFYDDVIEPPDVERRQLASLPFDEREHAAQLGVPGFGAGEPGWSILELGTVRPTLDVNGIYGGYTRQGASTIIPATVGAKLSMRLVPNQDPDRIAALFDAAIRARVPASVSLEIQDHSRAWPYVARLDSPLLQAATRALREAFDHEVAFLRSGGTLPILPQFRHELGADSVLLGLASPRCNAHGPNEMVLLADLDRGAEAVARLLAYLAE